MKTFILILLSVFTLSAATWDREISKRSGEAIEITWEYPADTPVDGFVVYRQTTISSAPAKFADLSPNTRRLNYIMPSGSTVQYRFRVMAIKGSSISPAGPEVVVNRIK